MRQVAAFFASAFFLVGAVERHGGPASTGVELAVDAVGDVVPLASASTSGRPLLRRRKPTYDAAAAAAYEKALHKRLKLAMEIERAAEKARLAAEKEKEAAHKAKKVAEAGRASAERARLAAQKEMAAAHEAKKVAEAGRASAEQARLAAQKEMAAATEEKKQARKDKRAAETEKEQAENMTAMVTTEQNCSTFLTRQVATEISVKSVKEGSSYIVDVPNGYMLFGVPVEAYRCTNRGACLDNGTVGRRWEGSKAEASAGACPLVPHSSLPALAMCAAGYNPQSPGCSRCSDGYGRASTDPFVCKACGTKSIQVFGHAIIVVSIFTVSFRGALARSGMPIGAFNDLLKIFLAFGSAAAVVMHAVVASDSFQTLPELPKGFFSFGEDSMDNSAAYAGSVDCLMGSTVGVQQALLLAFAQPVIIALLCAIIIPARRVVRGDRRPVRFYAVLVCLVLGNQFLPQIVGTSMSAMPCAHMQKSENGSLLKLMAFNLSVKCDDVPASLILGTVGTVMFAILCGPVFWWLLLRGGAATGDPAGEGGEHEAGKEAAAGEAEASRMPEGGDAAPGASSRRDEASEGAAEEGAAGRGQAAEGRAEDATGPPAGSEEGRAVTDATKGAGPQWQHDHESEGPTAEVAARAEDPAGFLIGNYREGCRFWEAIVLLRKMSLAIATTLAPMSYSPGQHIIFVQAILMLALIAHFYSMPYKKDILNKVEGLSLTVVNVALILAAYVTMDIWSATPLSKQVAAVAAGMLLTGWFVALIGLLIWAKWTETRASNPRP